MSLVVGFPLTACSGSLFSEAVRIHHCERQAAAADGRTDGAHNAPGFTVPLILMIARGQPLGLHLIGVEL